MKKIYRLLALALLCAAVAPLLDGCGGRTDTEAEAGSGAVAAGTDTLSIQKFSMADTNGTPPVAARYRRPDMRVRVLKGDALYIQTEGLSLYAMGESVKRGGSYSVTSLVEGELPSLPQGMVNMTASSAGYRLLPSGDHFSPAAELRVSYDPSLLPEGYTADDIHTSYFDSSTMAWVRLERIGVDTASHEIVSLTTHFTDFINELLKAPEMPETQAFAPTMMSDLEAANPMEGIALMQPPSASQDGSASLSYPLDIPAGRNGMQPSLSLTYNSGGGNGWLGEGWDIPIPTISVETRWGVPRYDASKESEVYLYKGEQLVAKDKEDDYLPLPHRTSTWHSRLPCGTQFFPRVNEAFDSIVRHGTTPDSYWWEVYDRSGVVHRYGHYETRDNNSNQSVLRDDNGNIAKWCLAESEDTYGNMVLYLYDTVQDAGLPGSIVKGRQIYPAEIRYTLHRDNTGQIDDTGHRKVVFFREDNDVARKHSYRYQSQSTDYDPELPPRIPAVINGRYGFKEVTASLLSHIHVRWNDTVSHVWYFAMRYGRASNYKPQLTFVHSKPVPEYNYDGEHTSQYDMGEKGVFYRGHDVYFTHDLTFEYHDAPVDIFDGETDLGPVWQNHTGTWFPYGDDVHSTQMSLTPVGAFAGTLNTTALGSTKGKGWSAGGGLDVGLGFDVFWTELAAGGDFSLSASSNESYLTMIDLDGDGLPDKVFKDKSGNVCYRKHMRLDDGTFYFGERTNLNIGSFLEVTSFNREYGLQVALGAHFTGSKTVSESRTSTYFADVNADGLPDLVTDGGVYFNDLVNGEPTFTKAPRQEDPTVADTIKTSTMPCGYIIYDGEVNDSIYCETVVTSVAHPCDNYSLSEYFFMTHQLETNNGWTITGYSNDSIFGYTYTLKCQGRRRNYNAEPDMEAVRVWVAPREGVVTVSDSIRMIPDRSGGVSLSRYADGVSFKVQHEHGVNVSGNHLVSATSNVVAALCGTLGKFDTTYTVRTASGITVNPGDILMFRLQSGNDRSYDRVDWRHTITYNDNSSLDPYGLSLSHYNSTRDFVVSSGDRFQAPDDGTLTLDIDIKTGSATNNVEVEVGFMSGSPFTASVASVQCTTLNVERNSSKVIPVTKGDTVSVRLNIVNPPVPWGSVECTPHYVFTPSATSDITAPVEYYIAPRVTTYECLVFNNIYTRLFGPLYRWWGQFSYIADGASLTDPIDIEDLVYNLNPSVSDTNKMKSVGDSVNANTFSFERLSSVMDATENYNPLSPSKSRWRRMDPDCRHKAWVGYGMNSVVTRTMTANTVPVEFYSDAGLMTDAGIRSSAPASTPQYPKVKTHARKEETVSYNLSGNVGGIYGTARSWSTNTTVSDYMDLNGDRYPDLLNEGQVQYTMPYGGLSSHVKTVAENIAETGCGSLSANISPGGSKQNPHKMFGRTNRNALISSEPDRPQVGASGAAVGGSDTSHCNYADINGDGLPDRVFGDGQVMLNIGYKFLPKEHWNCGTAHRGENNSLTVSASASLPPFNIANFSIGGGFAIGISDNKAIEQIVDINGDGLADKLVRNVSQNVREAYINLGNGSWKKIVLDIAEISHGTGYNENVSVSGTLGVTIGFAKITGTLNGSPLSRSFSCDRVSISDIDGDGLPDYVTSSLESNMTFRRNKMGKTGLLKMVYNLEDTAFVMDYTYVPPTYGQPQAGWALSSCRVVGDPAKGVPDRYSTFTYRNPHYDRYERMSFGYDTVVTCHYIKNSSGNFVPYRYITEGYSNNCYQKRGKKVSESVSGTDGKRWDETLYDVAVVDLEIGDTVGDAECPLVSHPLIEKTITNHYEGGNTPKLTTAVGMKYDNHRNVVEYTNWGDTNRAGDEVHAEMEYLGSQTHNLVSLRSSVIVYGGSQNTAAVMRRSGFTYNSRGSLTGRSDYYDATHSSDMSLYYDAYGNADSVVLPPNNAGQRMYYGYTFDPVLHCLPIATRDAYGRTSRAKYHYRYNKPDTVISVTGDTVCYTYDTLGRVTSVTAPAELAAHRPYTWKAERNYMYAKTSHYDSQHPSDPIETYTFCDRWGRVVQTKRDIEEAGTAKVLVSGRVTYDALGRAVRQYDPGSELPSPLSTYSASVTPLRTETVYDILDRQVACSTYHNFSPLTQTTAYSYQTYGTGALLSTAVTDPLNRTTTSLADAYGRTVSVTDAINGVTQFEYDRMGQLMKSTDPEGFETTYTYDLQGRPTSRAHPDAGTTTTEYDPAGNVKKQVYATGEMVTYTYDFLRPTLKHYSKFPQNDVTYTYDNQTGQLTEIQDGSGIQLFSYDALGNVSQNIRTFAVPNSNNTYTFTMDFVYDSWGRVLEMTYPDGERVEYGYNLGGDLLSMTGHKGLDIYNYIEDIRYDLFGNRTGIEYGNDTRSEYSYDDLQRLTRLKTYAMNGNNEVLIQDIAYTFDNVGNITDAANSATAFGTLGGVYSNHYVYDGIDRLTDASQSFGTGNVLEASYSPSGMLCRKSQTFTGQDVLFGYTEDNKPHAPRIAYGSNTLHNLLWDDLGNLAQVNLYEGEEFPLKSARYLYWTEDNRLVNVVDDDYFSYYAYDHSGERVLKLTGKNTQLDINADKVNYIASVENLTLYTSPYLVVNAKGYTKHYYAGTERVCARTGNGNLNHLNNFIGQNAVISARSTNLYKACIGEMEYREIHVDDLSGITYPCGDEPDEPLPELESAPIGVIVDAQTDVGDFEAAMTVFALMTQQSEEPFFYHADHLGSASWITDVHGVPVQHLQYLPFGESFVNQRAAGSTYNERFTFTGKEKDSETGYYAFGARYYDCDLSGLFLSVDPMADKYPSMSPYSYCAWNPVKLVDPNGKEVVDDWVKNKKTGRYEWRDNATSPNNTPDGYSYIGDDDALLRDLNVRTDYNTQEDCTNGYSPDLGSNYAGFTRSRNCNDATIRVSVSIKTDRKNTSSDNSNGITFNGINIYGYVNQWSKTASGETNTIIYNGMLVIKGTNGFLSQSGFSRPSEACLSTAGTVPMRAIVHIPPDVMYQNTLTSANIKLGHASASMFNRTKSFSWSLPLCPVIH